MYNPFECLKGSKSSKPFKSLHPIWEEKRKTNKLTLAVENKQQFYNNTAVKIDGHIFNIEFVEGMNPEQIGYTTFIKQFIHGMDDLPEQCEFSKIDFSNRDELKKLKLYLYYHSQPRQAVKEFNRQQIKQLFRRNNLKMYFNNNQNINFTMGKYQFDIRLQTATDNEQQDRQQYGYVSQNTMIFVERQQGQTNFKFVQKENEKTVQNIQNGNQNIDKNGQFTETFRDKLKKVNVGGIQEQIQIIARRVFASRQYGSFLTVRLGIKHVKGILLYGPPGTGKTTLAKEISKIFDVQPKIVNSPQIMDKFVGEGQKKLREVFEPALKQWKQKEHQSRLHVIIFDEIDTIAKKRGGSDSSIGDSLVNQLLTLIDGAESPQNILVIGMTNRKDLIDPALLRSGRLEVHTEIHLPDENGRIQILNIHLNKLQKNGYLSKDVNIIELAKITKNYTGAEIQAIIKSATSFALKQNEEKKRKQTQFKVEMKHFLLGKKQASIQFGQDEKQIQNLLPSFEIDMKDCLKQTYKQMDKLIKKCQNMSEGKLLVLIKGQPKTGKTTLAAKIAKQLNFSFTKLVNCEKIYNLNENQKKQHLIRIFQDSKRCKDSCILLDDLFRLIQYVPLGSKYSNTLLQLLIDILKMEGQKQKKRIIIATCDSSEVLTGLGLATLFKHTIQIPTLDLKQAQQLLAQYKIKMKEIVNTEEIENGRFTIEQIAEKIKQYKK